MHNKQTYQNENREYNRRELGRIWVLARLQSFMSTIWIPRDGNYSAFWFSFEVINTKEGNFKPKRRLRYFERKELETVDFAVRSGVSPKAFRVGLKSGQQCKRCEPFLTSLRCCSWISTDSRQTCPRHGSRKHPASSSGSVPPAMKCPGPSVLRPRRFLQASTDKWPTGSRHIPAPVLPVETGDFIEATEAPQLQGSILANPIPRACPSHAFIVPNSGDIIFLPDVKRQAGSVQIWCLGGSLYLEAQLWLIVDGMERLPSLQLITDILPL